ncbi:MAG TPA: UrcA family protein [Caulobacteraceae bacterium]|jgi:UrcA family protein|nr:UrcA family protein [Caulobacteraceae bacterium]
MQTKTLLTVLSAVAALGFAAQSQTAFAQSDDTVSIKVSSADLNLSSQAGAKVMLQRITTAAKSICGPAPQHPFEDLHNHFDSCVHDIVGKTVNTLGAPMVTAMNGGGTATALAQAR